MLMTRTNKMLEQLKDYFEDKGYYYGSKKGNNLVNADLLQAIDTWRKLNQGQLMPAKLAKKMYGFMSVKGKSLKRNFGNGASLEAIIEDLYLGSMIGIFFGAFLFLDIFIYSF